MTTQKETDRTTWCLLQRHKMITTRREMTTQRQKATETIKITAKGPRHHGETLK